MLTSTIYFWFKDGSRLYATGTPEAIRAVIREYREFNGISLSEYSKGGSPSGRTVWVPKESIVRFEVYTDSRFPNRLTHWLRMHKRQRISIFKELSEDAE